MVKMKNRSVPMDTVLPHIAYQSLTDAVDWLIRVFGFTEHYRYGDPVSGAQLQLSDAYIMVNSSRPGNASPSQVGHRTQSLTVFVDDVDHISSGRN
jgi:uncharacterized glyoxalase superfamily protein PhnB